MRQYSPDLIKVLWLGLQLHEGLAAGTFIQPKANVPTWTQKPNGYGGTLQIPTLDTSGKLTLIIDQEHKVHAQLQAFANADRIGQAFVAPLVVMDGNVREMTTYFKARLETMADPSKGTGAATVPWTWIFESFRTQVFAPDHNVIGT